MQTGQTTPKELPELFKADRQKHQLLDPRDIFVLQPGSPGANTRVDYGDMEGLMLSILKVGGLEQAVKGYFDRPTGKYCIIKGHRRHKACMMILERYGKVIPMAMLTVPKPLPEERYISILADACAKELNPLEQAESIRQLAVVYKMKATRIAEKTGKTPTYVSNLLLLSGAPEEVKDLIKSDRISSTLTVKIFRDYEYEEAIGLIRSAIASDSTGTAKITEKRINKAEGKVNSFSVLKKLIRKADKEDWKVLPSKVELYDFLTKLKDGEADEQFLMDELFYPVQIPLNDGELNGEEKPKFKKKLKNGSREKASV